MDTIYPTPRSICCDAAIEPGTIMCLSGVEHGACMPCDGLTRIRWDRPDSQEGK